MAYLAREILYFPLRFLFRPVSGIPPPSLLGALYFFMEVANFRVPAFKETRGCGLEARRLDAVTTGKRGGGWGGKLTATASLSLTPYPLPNGVLCGAAGRTGIICKVIGL